MSRVSGGSCSARHASALERYTQCKEHLWPAQQLALPRGATAAKAHHEQLIINCSTAFTALVPTGISPGCGVDGVNWLPSAVLDPCGRLPRDSRRLRPDTDSCFNPLPTLAAPLHPPPQV